MPDIKNAGCRRIGEMLSAALAARTRGFLRHALAFAPRLGKADRYGLLAAFYFAAASAFQLPALKCTHFARNVLARAARILAAWPASFCGARCFSLCHTPIVAMAG